MGHIDNLMTLDRKKGVLYVLSTSTIMLMLMIFFFYSYIVPKVNEVVNNRLDRAIIDVTTRVNNILVDYQNNNKIFDTIVPEISKRVFSEEISGILKTFSDREKKLIDKTNTYVKVSALIIILIMCGVLYVNKNNGGDISMPVLTLLIFGIFQIFFYKFANLYKYTGSCGYEEIIDTALNNIRIE
jgi:hypothetical protein